MDVNTYYGSTDAQHKHMKAYNDYTVILTALAMYVRTYMNAYFILSVSIMPHCIAHALLHMHACTIKSIGTVMHS